MVDIDPLASEPCWSHFGPYPLHYPRRLHHTNISTSPPIPPLENRVVATTVFILKMIGYDFFFFWARSCCSVVQRSCSWVMRPLPFPRGWGCYLILKRCVVLWYQLTANHAQITSQTFNCNTSMLKSPNWLWKICNLFKLYSLLTQNSRYNWAVCILKTFEIGCIKMTWISRVFYFLRSAVL